MNQPLFSVIKNDDGSMTSASTANVSTINWAALLQAIVAAMPAIMAILAAFTSSPAPVPPPPKTEEKA